jgi:hypothetical protein
MGYVRFLNTGSFRCLHRLIAMGVYLPDWGMDGKSIEPPSWDASVI